jgi:lysylphosphatidylglycerol synthetase-like protein (DUF2156 family)
MANVRHSVTHAERAGLRVHVCRLADAGEELRTQLAAISRAWLSGKMSAEMAFSMGTFGEFGWLPHGHSVPARVPA